MPQKILFEGNIYGEGGGVIREVQIEATSAEDAAQTLADSWRGYPQAARVQVWARDRKSGYAGTKIEGK